jgi:hypothetical protein
MAVYMIKRYGINKVFLSKNIAVFNKRSFEICQDFRMVFTERGIKAKYHHGVIADVTLIKTENESVIMCNIKNDITSTDNIFNIKLL